MKPLILGLALMAATLNTTLAQGLSGIRWEYRPLLLFTPTKTDENLSRQTTLLADALRGMEERKLAVYVVERDRVFTLYGAPAPGIDHDTLRDRFSVPDAQFRVVLIGLDGGAKLTSDEVVPIERLFDLIDGMPMRQREIRQQEQQQRGG
ncbi:MAG: DUF4174 domain-containing protein [Pseudomonadota bacterium]